MFSPHEAAEAILTRTPPLASEEVATNAALGRVLAEDISSPFDFPHWDNSAMDGYAARTADLEGPAPLTLTIVEEIAAGAFPGRTLEAGECARIFTGAPTPDGSDCVIRQEDTTRLDATHVQIDDLRDVGRNRRPRGEDMRRGETVLTRHTQIGPAQLGVLVSLARTGVSVYRRPTVAVLASGDEIADLDEAEAILAGHKIGSSNSYTLISSVEQAGGAPLSLGIVRDDPEALRARMERARGADLIVTSAGISVGEHDYLHTVLDDLGVHSNFWRIRMRPGAPVGFGLVGALDDTPWIGLPGNPVSTMVTFELLVRPAIRKMQGLLRPFRRTIPVRMERGFKLGPRLTHFQRVTLDQPENGELPTAHLTGPQGSGLLTSMARADALLVVPEDVATVAEGDVLRAIVLDDARHVEEAPW